MRIRTLSLAMSLAGAALLASGSLATAQSLSRAPQARAVAFNAPAAFSEPGFDEPAFNTQNFDAQDFDSAAVAGDEDAQLPARLQRQIVRYDTREPPGTIVIDTPHTYLYYVLGDGRAIRYGIGVGREGFTWSGVRSVTRKAEWPDWYPPAEMIARQPYLPRMTSGGPGNPLGARALYIGGTLYRIHGTNDPSTIGRQVSSGCIRLTNTDVIDLYNRAAVGAKVVVLPQTRNAQHRPAPTAAASQNERVSSYAPQPQRRSEAAWTTIRPAGLY
ncbi:MAG TPA: L,D-transpeptidase [Pseudolabrys sp.]|nr:L,D-transpeptidase [Pseudolabrys sp.]